MQNGKFFTHLKHLPLLMEEMFCGIIFYVKCKLSKRQKSSVEVII